MECSDLINEDTFIISDTHLGHRNILEFEPCRLTAMNIDGFSDHDDFIISKINDEVGAQETLLVLGDFAFKAIAEYTDKIKAKNKVIILGNHDRKPSVYSHHGWNVIDGVHYCLDGFKSPFIYNDPSLSLLSGVIKTISGKRVMLSHYPLFNKCSHDRKNIKISQRMNILELMYSSLDCEVDIHGHTHSMSSDFVNSINACCEPLYFKPERISEIIKKSIK